MADAKNPRAKKAAVLIDADAGARRFFSPPSEGIV